MKKVLTSLFAVIICVISAISFVGCAPEWSGFSNTVPAETVNGGIAVNHGDYIYFINGTKNTGEDANKGDIVQGAIYRAKVNADGELEYEDDDKKTLKNVEKVVNALVGFKNGSIHIFGNYLYYATTSNRVNSSNEVLFGQIEFARYDLETGASETFYTTKKSDDTISYTYYVNGNKLDFVIFEKNNATLTSLSISDEVTENFVKTEITGAIMGENYGVSEKTTTDNVVDDAECYVFYTKAADPDGEFTEGNRVYASKSDGTGEKLLSEKNDSVTLFAVACGKLIYTVNGYVYADAINSGVEALSFNTDDLSTIISYQTYDKDGEQVMFVERDDKLALLVYTGAEIKFVDWSGYPVFNDDTVYDFGDADVKIAFVDVVGDYLYFTRDKKLNKIKIFNVGAGETPAPIVLSSSSFDAASDMMVTKIADGYAYGFVTSSSKTYMYRVALETEDSEPQEAEFIGVKEQS